MRIEDSKALAAGFEANTPSSRSIFSAPAANRSSIEPLPNIWRAKTTYDVLNAFALKVLQNSGMSQPYAAPEATHYPVGFKDAQNFWVSLYSGYNVIGYNTKLVPKGRSRRKTGMIS